jgi:hypothetical protein
MPFDAGSHYWPSMSLGNSGGCGDPGFGDVCRTGGGASEAGVFSITDKVAEYFHFIGSAHLFGAYGITDLAPFGGRAYHVQAAGGDGLRILHSTDIPSEALNEDAPWAPVNGNTGIRGNAGRSGGGGGGTGSISLYERYDCSYWTDDWIPIWVDDTCVYLWEYSGTYGESGSTGGCGGNGGYGGGPGNTLIGLVVEDEVFPTVDNVSINVSAAGAGQAGQQGQKGGFSGATHASAVSPPLIRSTSRYRNGVDGGDAGDGYNDGDLGNMVANGGAGGVGAVGTGGGGGGGGSAGWSIAVLTYGAEVPTGASSGLELTVPDDVAVGGNGGAGGADGNVAPIDTSPAGPVGVSGNSCRTYNAFANTGTTCVNDL